MKKIPLICSLTEKNLVVVLVWLGLTGLLLGTSFLSVASPVSDINKNLTAKQKLESIVASRAAFYAGHFPDIDFVMLDSAGNVEKNMHSLYRILGEDPVPLDYAHPEEMRYSLLMSTFMRIQLLLQADVESATLFSPGKGAVAQRKQVCIVTLNPWLIAKNNAAATRHLLDLPERTFKLIPRSHYLDHVAHLLFILDHEIYHCLDTHFNGSIPMSHKLYWGEYQMLRNEDGADAFAILMQMKSHGQVTEYVRMLALIRGLMLLSKDTDHYTYPAIKAAMQMNPNIKTLDNVQGCFRIATRIRNRVVKSYTDYLRFAVAAEKAMRKMGMSVNYCQYDKINADPALVDKLVAQTRDAYRKLIGRPMPRNTN